MGDNLLTPQLEERLLRRAIEGDGEAFGKIYDAYRRTLYTTVIFPRLNNVDAAEEVLQETFLLALKKLGTFEWQGKSVFFWLRMIAINKVREWLNNQRRTATVDDAVLAYHHDNTFQPEARTIEEHDTALLRQRIGDVLKNINERYRDAIELRLLRKLPRAECARTLDVTVETFDVIFFRACKSFKEHYIKQYGHSIDPV
jgi:RNA polymerase sigma-70 factor, ECF subfamily